MTTATAEQAALNLSPRAKLEILGAMLLAMFLFALDQTVGGYRQCLRPTDEFWPGPRSH